MKNQQNKPAVTLRDGAIKATIWKNASEKGAFYSVEVSRTYTTETAEGEKPDYRDSHSFSGTDLLKLSLLTRAAYQKISELRQIDDLERKQQNVA